MILLARTFHMGEFPRFVPPSDNLMGGGTLIRCTEKKNADMTILILHAGGHLLLYSILGISHILPWPGNRRHSKPWLVNTS